MITIFQMDSEEGLVSQLLGDGGGQNFFVDVLLLLNPEDLNACRQVSDISKKKKYFLLFPNIWPRGKSYCDVSTSKGV